MSTKRLSSVHLLSESLPNYAMLDKFSLCKLPISFCKSRYGMEKCDIILAAVKKINVACSERLHYNN